MFLLWDALPNRTTNAKQQWCYTSRKTFLCNPFNCTVNEYGSRWAPRRPKTILSWAISKNRLVPKSGHIKSEISLIITAGDTAGTTLKQSIIMPHTHTSSLISAAALAMWDSKLLLLARRTLVDGITVSNNCIYFLSILFQDSSTRHF